MSIFDDCRVMTGAPIARDMRTRLRAYLSHPSVETWDDVHSIVINADIGEDARPRTVWQAVIAVDPSFPHRRARGAWERYPDVLTFVRAIKAATGQRFSASFSPREAR